MNFDEKIECNSPENIFICLELYYYKRGKRTSVVIDRTANNEQYWRQHANMSFHGVISSIRSLLDKECDDLCACLSRSFCHKCISQNFHKISVAVGFDFVCYAPLSPSVCYIGFLAPISLGFCFHRIQQNTARASQL